LGLRIILGEDDFRQRKDSGIDCVSRLSERAVVMIYGLMLISLAVG
jgi:hypothetical protein